MSHVITGDETIKDVSVCLNVSVCAHVCVCLYVHVCECVLMSICACTHLCPTSHNLIEFVACPITHNCNIIIFKTMCRHK